MTDPTTGREALALAIDLLIVYTTGHPEDRSVALAARAYVTDLVQRLAALKEAEATWMRACEDAENEAERYLSTITDLEQRLAAAEARVIAEECAHFKTRSERDDARSQLSTAEAERDAATGLQDAAARRLAACEAENRVLRGVVQTNPDWKCPHGTGVDHIGKCPYGFPGCACADDRIAVLCEDEERVVSRLRSRLSTAEAEREELWARFDRITDACARWGWEHCTTERELIEAIDELRARHNPEVCVDTMELCERLTAENVELRAQRDHMLKGHLEAHSYEGQIESLRTRLAAAERVAEAAREMRQHERDGNDVLASHAQDKLDALLAAVEKGEGDSA